MIQRKGQGNGLGDKNNKRFSQKCLFLFTLGVKIFVRGHGLARIMKLLICIPWMAGNEFKMKENFQEIQNIDGLLYLYV